VYLVLTWKLLATN